MGCIVVLVVLAMPRLAIFLMQVFSNRMELAMPSFVVGFLGFLLLPFTTAMYAVAYDPIRGVEGIGWFLVALAFVTDMVGHFGGGKQYQSRQTVVV